MDNKKDNDIKIELYNSTFPIKSNNLTEIEVILLLKKYKKQIIEECKKIIKRRNFNKIVIDEQDKLINYLFDLINNIEEDD